MRNLLPIFKPCCPIFGGDKAPYKEVREDGGTSLTTSRIDSNSSAVVKDECRLLRMSAAPNDSTEAMKRNALMVDFYKELEAFSEIHHDEPKQNEEEWELFEDDSSREEETQDLYIDKESQ
ncbi:hypothetical protein TIFTF001_034230 [Ficus carica]|uniref:Uncharacterized protein n=1 Tax=Ficus carica TaxID=3494 RepID=A0AA88E2D6_FICCA|nr:hypothetical protein TIFTF001_034230 [Ficus carica]